MNSLIFQNLSRICSRQGWRLSITNENDDETYLDFIYHTSSGEPFTISICFTELYEVADEIMTEFENFKLDRNLQYFLEGITNLTPETYLEVIKEVEIVRQRIWILALEIEYLADRLHPLLQFLRKSMN